MYSDLGLDKCVDELRNDTCSNGVAAGGDVDWVRSVVEVKEQAFARLQNELKEAHQELKLRDEEVSRLSRIRQDVEAELEDLTASLFQVRMEFYVLFIYLIISSSKFEIYINCISMKVLFMLKLIPCVKFYHC